MEVDEVDDEVKVDEVDLRLQGKDEVEVAMGSRFVKIDRPNKHGMS